MFTLYGEISCVGNMVYSYSWEAYMINPNDNSIKKAVDLSKNPTASSIEILIDAYTLGYGLYEFVFQVKGTWNGMKKIYSQNTYQKIIPTGLAISGLKNGVSCTEIGSKQTFSLNPVEFSFDFDYVASMQNLKFDFYCRKVYKNQTYSNIAFQYLNNKTLSNNSIDCFNNSSKNLFKEKMKYFFKPVFLDMYDLDLTTFILTINPGSLISDTAYDYELSISTTYLNSLYSQNVFLAISQFDVIPIVTLG